MIEIFLSCIASSVLLLISGNLFCTYFLNQNIYENCKFYENSLFGIICLSFLALIINFIAPLSKIIGTTLFLGSFILFIIYLLKSKYKKNLLLYIFYTSTITFFLIFLSNINRPDAGLYHLPYTSLVNESKIILGSTNIHFRFGHISIMQYVLAIYNNYLFSTSIITIPLASLVSVFFVYLVKEFYLLFNLKRSISILIFLILIFSIFNFNRYSSLGNDAPAHIYFFLLIIYFLKINILSECDKITFFKICIISIFLATLKLFLTITLIIPAIIFLASRYKKGITFNKSILIFSVLGLFWLLKNVLVSGCLFYPVQKTCFKSLVYYDHEQTKEAEYAGEAWAKGWSDQKGEILKYEDYNKNFNWFKTWSKKHLKKIIEKISPFLAFLILLTIVLIYKKRLSKEKYKLKILNQKRLFQLFIMNLFFLFLWFFKFPIFRYGLSFIGLLMIIITYILISNFVSFNNKKIFSIFIIIGFTAFFIKNSIRINDKLNNHYFDYPWPQIYSLNVKDKNNPKKFEMIINKNQNIYYYSNQELCMYSKSPCSNYNLQKLNKRKVFSYDLYWINKV